MICENLGYIVNTRTRKYKARTYYESVKLPFKDWKPVTRKDGVTFLKTIKWTKHIDIKMDNQYWNKILPFSILKARYDETTIKRFLKQKIIILVPCGKCKHCIAMKQNKDLKRVNAQFKHSAYCYFITFTMRQDNIKLVVHESERQQYLENDNLYMSYLSTLSKKDDELIIRNLKNKLWRFYGKENVKLHYYTCGEYGSNTKRAHYHMLLMLNKPIPDLVREPTQKEIYKSKMISSKQFGMYMLEKCDKKIGCAKYISKYMNKESSKLGTYRMNRFQEMQQRYILSSPDYDPSIRYLLFKQPKHLILFYLDPLLFVNLYWSSLNMRRVATAHDTYQAEFIKKSRSLGITGNYYVDFINKTLNPYYLRKFDFTYWRFINIYIKLLFLQQYDLSLIIPTANWLYCIVFMQFIRIQIDKHRCANIDKYLFSIQESTNISKYLPENDIF